MAFFDKYPYTDMHELNLDWVISKMGELEHRLDTIKDELKAELTVELEAYVDEQLANIVNEFNALKVIVNNLSDEFDDLKDAVNDFENAVNTEISNIRSYIDAQIAGCNARTDILIASNNQYILDQMSQYLRNLTVINYFTGEEVSVQDMFNYLANLHLTDGINYNTITARGYTYNSIEALNLTYSDIIMHGNTLLP